MTELTLYTTAGCHLCELAYTLLTQVDAVIQQIEIGDNDDLITRYGTIIPVVKFADNTELNWPFGLNELKVKVQDNT